jgi:hypothetical protein
MHLSPVLNADGKVVVNFGGKLAHQQWTRNGYVISLEWRVDPDNHKRTDGVMAIWPATQHADAGAWAITRRGIMKFCDSNNRPTPHAFDEAWKALPILGRAPLQMEVHKLIDTVMSFVDELVQMPSTPPAIKEQLRAEPMFEIIRRDGDRKVISQTEV